MAKTVYTSTNIAVNSSKNVWIGFATDRAKRYTVGSESRVSSSCLQKRVRKQTVWSIFKPKLRGI